MSRSFYKDRTQRRSIIIAYNEISNGGLNLKKTFYYRSPSFDDRFNLMWVILKNLKLQVNCRGRGGTDDWCCLVAKKSGYPGSLIFFYKTSLNFLIFISFIVLQKVISNITMHQYNIYIQTYSLFLLLYFSFYIFSL